jgi:hypothetical protein
MVSLFLSMPWRNIRKSKYISTPSRSQVDMSGEALYTERITPGESNLGTYQIGGRDSTISNIDTS